MFSKKLRSTHNLYINVMHQELIFQRKQSNSKRKNKLKKEEEETQKDIQSSGKVNIKNKKKWKKSKKFIELPSNPNACNMEN